MESMGLKEKTISFLLFSGLRNQEHPLILAVFLELQMYYFFIYMYPFR